MSERLKALIALLLYFAAADVELRVDEYLSENADGEASGVVMPSRPPCSPGRYA